MNKLNIVDMFCGGGGESTGLIEAAHDYNFDINMSAINHWERAIETHSQNYPYFIFYLFPGLILLFYQDCFFRISI
ncbi:hypothetical protein [Treponema sp.]|uniref:hypothetical protein n=1 Tax=Treponema sp. TaxID=166 RepID=UPI00257A8548|nr:hypothetical protein [Treponema sp.]MBE6353819.1 DNA cytosine methyltransferase [Treponema sp.]